MSIALSSPLTGAPQTGFTTPAYTHVPDTAPPGNPGKQYAITGLTGTQTGVTLHSVSSPFVINFTKPAVAKTIGTPNPVTGVITNVPNNVYKVITLKGVTPSVGQPIKTMSMVTTTSIPAGADTYDAPNVRACYSAHIGAVWVQSSGMGDLGINGVL